jgi:hypothetical protein
MRSTLLFLTVCAALGLPARLRAQDLPELRHRLEIARAQQPMDSESVARRIREGLINSNSPIPQAIKRRAEPMVLSRGPGLVVSQRTGSADELSRVAARVDSAIREFGGFDTSRLGHIALIDKVVLMSLALSPADEQRLAGYELLPLPSRFRPPVDDGLAYASLVEDAQQAIAAALEPEALRRWTADLAVTWDSVGMDRAVIEELFQDPSRRAAECLSGSADSCTAYLAIDEGADSLRHRFTAEEVLRFGRRAGAPGGSPAAECGNGRIAACYEILAQEGFVAESEPIIRQSLLHYVRQRFGADAVRRVFLDSGPMGARFRRATGQEPRDLAAAWRSHVLASSAWQPVHAGLGDALPAIVLCVVLVTLAARSGRWRA